MTTRQTLIQRIVLGTLLALISAAMFYFIQLSLGIDLFSRSPRVIFLMGVGILFVSLLWLIMVSLLVITWIPMNQRVMNLLHRAFQFIEKMGKWNLFWFTIGIGIFAFLMIGPYNRYFATPLLRWSAYGLLVMGGGVLVKAAITKVSWSESLIIASLISAVGYKLALFIPEVSTYPFSLGWSEASRYYYASLLFSERLYGFQIPPTVLHPSRYLIQAVPFMLPDSPIWLHRIWQVFLWVGISLISAILLKRRLSIPNRLHGLGFILWIWLFLLVPPVYYHLQVVIILILLGFDRNKFWQNTLIVLLASIWAGISRVNWFPVPGMLATLLYFLEEPIHSSDKPEKSPLRYLLKPVLWIISGTLIAFGSQALYAFVSGNPAEQFSSSFTSDLLWYRLLPSATYPLGVLPGVLLFSLPLFLIIGMHLSKNRSRFHPLRLLGIGGLLLVLFAGGLVVSVKIGGGSNLHNLDAFLVLLLVSASYSHYECWATEAGKEITKESLLRSSAVPTLLSFLAILVPVLFTINSNPAYRLPKLEHVEKSIQAIQEAIDQVASTGGDVLFISERQLLMFGDVNGIALIPDYEKVFLMEMAMANNPNYLEAFHRELRSQRFDLIISEPLKVVYQDRSNSFGEENNAWVERVTVPILCFYEPAITLKSERTQLLVPKPASDVCSMSLPH